MKQSNYDRAKVRREVVLELITGGLSVHEAIADHRVGVSYSAYKKWRERDPKWSAAIDVARATGERNVKRDDLTSAQFALRYFGRVRQPFQQLWIDKIEKLRPGNILLALWPPEYGKTTTFADYATEQIARRPEWRNTTISESDAIAKRIVGRVRNRLEVDGPTRLLVKEWGPFRAQIGGARDSTMSLPWNNAHFSVTGKRDYDEGDHTMLALGWNSSTVSIRTDHLHVDDLQSLKTLSRTTEQLERFRQDGLSRPGETGITTVSGTRVGEDDFYVNLLEDDELDGILEVVRFPAIITDPDGTQRPLWPAKHSLDALDRIRRKIKDPAFDRNYMQDPGRSKTNRAFSEKGWEKATLPSRKLNVPDQRREGQPKPVLVGASDPGMDPGKATFGLWVMTEANMRLVYFNESDKFLRNEELIGQYQAGFRWSRDFYALRAHIIEANNFQKGLARDEQLTELCKAYGIKVQEHITGINKYDESIGIASMATDWEAGRILLPYGDDEFTRTEVDEFHKQFKAWKPGKRGTELRMDRVMMTWFAWIWWQDNRHRLARVTRPIRREGLPYGATAIRPIIPIGAKIL